MKTSSDAENPVEVLKILEKEKMKRLERRQEKKTANAFRQTVASCFCTSPSIYTFTRSPPFALDCSFHVFFAPRLSLSLSLPERPVVSHPRRRSGLIIISQARPHQETWLLMREKSIPLSRPLPSLSLPQSIYPLSLLFSTPSPPHPLFFN